jgi:hypothetical protein
MQTLSREHRYICTYVRLFTHARAHVSSTYIMQIHSYTRTHPTTHTHVELQDPNGISWERNLLCLLCFVVNDTEWHALLASKGLSEAANALDDCGLYFEDRVSQESILMKKICAN